MHRFRNIIITSDAIDQAAAGKNIIYAYIITLYIVCVFYLFHDRWSSRSYPLVN